MAAAKHGDFVVAFGCVGLAILLGGLAWFGVGRSIEKA